MIGELSPQYQSGAKRTCLFTVILRKLQAVYSEMICIIRKIHISMDSCAD